MSDNTNNVNQTPVTDTNSATTPVVPNQAPAVQDASVAPQNDTVQSTQVQGSQTVVPLNNETQTVDIPSEKVDTQKQNIGIESGNTELLDLSAITSNVAETNSVEIVETAAIKGASGSAIIGTIAGETATANNNPLPKSIDLNAPKEHTKKDKNKKVKVVTKKEKIMSIVITIFVIIVLGGSGYAAYYFGYATNPSIYSVKTINLELGDILSASVSDYVEGGLQLDDMEYVLDISQVAQDIIGTYKYTVKHGNVEKEGTIIVKDTKAPVLTFKDSKQLVFMKDDKVTKTDIVETCEDISNCEYKLEAQIDTSSVGEKTVNVIASDEQDNKQTYTTTIKVLDIKRTITCSSTPIPSEDNTYNSQTTVELNFDGYDQLVLTKKYNKAVYTDYAAYFNTLEQYKENEEYVFDNTTFSYRIEDKKPETINVTSFDDVLQHYKDQGYTCK